MSNFSESKKEQILQLIEDKQAEIISATAKILTFRTISVVNAEEEKSTEAEFYRAFNFLKDLCVGLGLNFRLLEDKVGIVELRAKDSAAEQIGVLLHIDVMPEGKAEWKYEPFGGRIAEGKIWGRGAQDDKGPLIAALFGLWAAKEAAQPDNIRRSCRLIIGTREETGKWDDIHFYKRVEGQPDFCIVPDAEFPIIVAEKGMVNIELWQNWAERPRTLDSSVALVSLIAGERANMVPDLAELILERLNPDAIKLINSRLKEFKQIHSAAEFKFHQEDSKTVIKFLGKSAHGSRPFEGRNAGVTALNFINFLQMTPTPFSSFVEFIAQAGENIWGEALGIKSEHPFVGKTTSSLGLVRLNEKEGSAIFNIRNTLGLTVKEVEERIRQQLEERKEETGREINLRRGSSGTEALFVDPDEFRFYLEPLRFAFEAVTGKKAEVKAIGGSTFAKAFSRAVSFGPVWLVEEAEMAHQTDEHVKIEHQLRNAKIYALALWGLITKQ